MALNENRFITGHMAQLCEIQMSSFDVIQSLVQKLFPLKYHHKKFGNQIGLWFLIVRIQVQILMLNIHRFLVLLVTCHFETRYILAPFKSIKTWPFAISVLMLAE